MGRSIPGSEYHMWEGPEVGCAWCVRGEGDCGCCRGMKRRERKRRRWEITGPVVEGISGFVMTWDGNSLEGSDLGSRSMTSASIWWKDNLFPIWKQTGMDKRKKEVFLLPFYHLRSQVRCFAEQITAISEKLHGGLRQLFHSRGPGQHHFFTTSLSGKDRFHPQQGAPAEPGDPICSPQSSGWLYQDGSFGDFRQMRLLAAFRFQPSAFLSKRSFGKARGLRHLAFAQQSD